MSEERYRVIFTGKLVAGVSGKQALDNLCQLFRKTPEEVRKVFARPGTTVRSNLERARAEAMLAGLTKAGVQCLLQRMPEATPVPSAAAPAPRPPAPRQDGTRRLALAPAATDPTLAPISCGRIGAHPGGIETPRLDRSFIAFSDILAVALFTPAEGSKNIDLLLFSSGHKRPLLVSGMQIAFSDFPDVPATNQLLSLRNFLSFLSIQNPALMLDAKSADFMDGGAPPILRDDPVVLASALYAAMQQSGADLQRIPVSAPAPGSAVGIKPLPVRPPVASGVSASPAAPEAPEATGDAPPPLREIDLRSELEGWVDRWPLPLLCILLAGFLLPLLKRSLMFDSYQLVWFWHQLGFGLDAERVAAMATLSGDKGESLYALLPLACALPVLLAAVVVPKRWRGLVLLLAGLVPLLLAFVVFYPGGEVFGLIFLPVTAAGGGMMLVLLVAALLVAAVNHLGRQAIVHPHLRILQGVGALVLLILTGLAFVAPDWNSFALYLLYLVWLLIALLGLKQAIAPGADQGGRQLLSLLLRLSLLLTPIAAVIAQSVYDNPFATYVVAGAGGLVPLVIASLKAFLIFYGMALAVGVGLVQLLGRFYAGR